MLFAWFLLIETIAIKKIKKIAFYSKINTKAIKINIYTVDKWIYCALAMNFVHEIRNFEVFFNQLMLT